MHTAILFLARYICAPRLQYLLRSSPLYTNGSGLQAVDMTVRSVLTAICDVQLGNGSWTQATLPVNHSGIGVRSVEKLALPCYSSLLTAALPLIASTIPSILHNSETAALQPALNCFQA